MGICKRKNKEGKKVFVVQKRWPCHAGRVRKDAPNWTAAKALLTRIEQSILDGTWRKLKAELEGRGPTKITFSQFAERVIEEHAKTRLRSWKDFARSLRRVARLCGNIQLSEFRRGDLNRYVQQRRQGDVENGTVNREIAAVKKMFSYALEVGEIDLHPLVRFPKLAEPERAFRLLTVAEMRRLVAAMPDPTIGTLIAVLAETGIRKGDGLKLRWNQVDLKNGTISVEISKTGKVRQIPLSDYAMGALGCLTRYASCPYVFVNDDTLDRWKNPEKVFKKGCTNASLPWVGFHDLRRFRACQWLLRGVDIETVRDLLGHASIQTTMKYLRGISVSQQTPASVRKAQAAELEELKRPINGQQLI